MKKICLLVCSFLSLAAQKIDDKKTDTKSDADYTPSALAQYMLDDSKRCRRDVLADIFSGLDEVTPDTIRLLEYLDYSDAMTIEEDKKEQAFKKKMRELDRKPELDYESFPKIPSCAEPMQGKKCKVILGVILTAVVGTVLLLVGTALKKYFTARIERGGARRLAKRLKRNSVDA